MNPTKGMAQQTLQFTTSCHSSGNFPGCQLEQTDTFTIFLSKNYNAIYFPPEKSEIKKIPKCMHFLWSFCPRSFSYTENDKLLFTKNHEIFYGKMQ